MPKGKQDDFLHSFSIDKLTDSILNTVSGDSFQTEVQRLTKPDLNNVAKKYGWNFEWRKELEQDDREVYKLIIASSPAVIQGLLSVSVKTDHVYMNLLESAPFNIGKNKLYEGVAGNLVAFACKLSFQRGCDGFVSFRAKTKLIEHYTLALGAIQFGRHLMVIDTEAAKTLVDKYFKS
jgi:hypothetical protein